MEKDCKSYHKSGANNYYDLHFMLAKIDDCLLSYKQLELS